MSRSTPATAPWWTPVATRALGLTPRILEGDDVDDALSLLYEVYVDEQGWNPPQANPSGLVVEHDRRRLTDDLVDDAVWVGVYRGCQLVGVTRLLARSQLGTVEMERYVELPRALVEVEGELVEANRLAIHRDYRRAWVLLVLQLATEWVGRQLGAVRSLAAMTPRQAARVERNLGWHRAGCRFRYHPDDPNPVDVIHFDREDVAPLRTLGIMARRQLARLLPWRSRPTTAA